MMDEVGEVQSEETGLTQLPAQEKTDQIEAYTEWLKNSLSITGKLDANQYLKELSDKQDN